MRAFEIAELHIPILRISTADSSPAFFIQLHCDIPSVLLTHLASLALALALIICFTLASGPSSSVSIENAQLAGFVVLGHHTGCILLIF
jgi:hypothetical protein